MPVVPRWDPVARWMHFPALTASGFAIPVYTLAWRILDHPDEWTYRLTRFKCANRADVVGAAHVLRVALPELLAALRLERSAVSLTVALSSGSSRLNTGSSLARIGSWLSKEMTIAWLPDLYEKEPHRSLHSLGSGPDRDNEVEGKYRYCGTVETPVLFILDDLTTRGAFKEMRRALLEVQEKVRVIGIALGKNEKKDFAAEFGVTVDNSHVPAEWGELWSKG